MEYDPFDSLLSRFVGNGRDPSSFFWNPLHPSAMFCVLCAIAAMVLASLLRGAG